MTRTHVATGKLNRADFPTRHRIGVLIGEHYDTTKGKYLEGWNDKRIVALIEAEVGRDVSEFTVNNVRRDLFGNFKEQPRAVVAQLVPVVEELVAKVAALEATTGGLGLRVTNLEDAMTKPAAPPRTALPFPPQHAKRVTT